MGLMDSSTLQMTITGNFLKFPNWKNTGIYSIIGKLMGQTIPVLGKIEVQNPKIGLKLRSMYPLFRNWELYVIFFQSNPKFGKNQIFSPKIWEFNGTNHNFLGNYWESIYSSKFTIVGVVMEKLTVCTNIGNNLGYCKLPKTRDHSTFAFYRTNYDYFIYSIYGFKTISNIYLYIYINLKL